MRPFRILAAALSLFALVPALAAEATASSREQAVGVIRELRRIVAPEGVERYEYVPVGGIQQFVSIRGQDRANPVILFIHGGPASPQIPSLWQFQRPLEEYFTMVNYDQRGAGRTYGEAPPEQVAGTLQIQTYVDDAIEIAEHIRAKLGKQKVVLMAHSWGSIVGMRAALQRPDLFHAYVGIGQVINTMENEQLSVAYGLEQARRHDNKEAVAEIESISPYPGDAPLTRERIVIARKWPQHYGGLSAFRDGSNVYHFGAARLSPDYSPAERSFINDGSLFTLDRVIDEFLAVDFNDVREFPIPGGDVHGPPRLHHALGADRTLAGQGAGTVQAGRVVRALGAHDAVGGTGQDPGQPAQPRAAPGRRPYAGSALTYVAAGGCGRRVVPDPAAAPACAAKAAAVHRLCWQCCAAFGDTRRLVFSSHP